MCLGFAGPASPSHHQEQLVMADLYCHDVFSSRTAGCLPFQQYEPGHDHPTHLEAAKPEVYTPLLSRPRLVRDWL